MDGISEEWQGTSTTPKTREEAIISLLAEMEVNDTSYLSMVIDRQAWEEKARSIDERLAVIGLRLTFRPWRNGTQER